MKKIASYHDKLTAEFVAQALVANQINAIVAGAKDYTSHILGSDLGTYDLMVNEADAEIAQTFINDMKTHNESETETITINNQVYFKKAVLFSLMASFMIPILFNYVALKNLNLYLKNEKISSKKYLRTIIVIVLQAPVIYYIYLYIYFIFHSFHLI